MIGSGWGERAAALYGVDAHPSCDAADAADAGLQRARVRGRGQDPPATCPAGRLAPLCRRHRCQTVDTARSFC